MDELHHIVDLVNQHGAELMDCRSETQMIQTFNYTLAAEILIRFHRYDPITGEFCGMLGRLMQAELGIDLKTIDALLTLYNSIRTLEASEMAYHG